MIDLRLGDYREVLCDVEPDCVIVDAPYGARTHAGHDAGVKGLDRERLGYTHWTAADVGEFVRFWSPCTSGWICAMTSHDLFPAWEHALEAQGRYVFAPVPVVIPGMTVRLTGDGPSSWCVWMVVSRPRTKAMASWGTLPGAYHGKAGQKLVTGGKDVPLMSAIIRDYSRPGDLVCDPCAGGGTTLLAAAIEGRRAIGSEIDPATHAKATKRLAAGYTPGLFT